MDLRTTYLGLDLPNPLMPGASPLVDELGRVKELEDAGAHTVVMHSLFEEQLRQEELGSMWHWEEHGEAFAEALSFTPPPESFALGPDEYLEQIGRILAQTELQVIGSLNGVTDSGWLEYARLIEQAGACALELNVYHVASDPNETGEEVEQRLLRIVRRVDEAISIPVAVKLSPFFSALGHLAHGLIEAGASGLVLFNRFYQPDLDVEELDVVPRLQLSTSAELGLRVQWTAILSAQLETSIAITGGVHEPVDVVKAILAGADAVQVVSALLRHGPRRLGQLRDGLARWLEEKGYGSVAEARGALSVRSCPDPNAYERGNYLRTLQSWRADRLPTGTPPGSESGD